MDTLLLMLVCGLGYIVAYNTYGRFISKKIFKLRENAPVPSVELQDGIDYVPARRGIIFGHHYTSIAGTGPIVGPAIGIIWGWLPAILWVLFGCILIGAVHDFGSLVVSMRNQGKSISEVAARYINARVRILFFIVVFLTLLIVIAIFGLVIATVFARFPSSVVPVWLQIPIAILLGRAVYKKGASVGVATLVAVIGMYLCIGLGAWIHSHWPGVTDMPALGAQLADGTWKVMPATGVWTIILLIYAFVASTLPVTVLLQPRDYINAWQLFIAMALLVAGTIVCSVSGDLPMVAPMINRNLPANTPPLWPFLFVIIACGAVSGFHSLVASGTSPKQISKEPHCQMIGYGSMLLEGFLAVLVIICVGAGIGMALKTVDGNILTGVEAWRHQYGTWIGAKGLPDKIAPVVLGAANMMSRIGLPQSVGIALMGVFIASFAGTTLDTAVRLQRYIVSELATDIKIPFLANRWAATTLAVVTAAALAFGTGAGGKGAMILWPLFGSANQCLATLALLVVTIYLRQKGGIKFIISAIPCAIMIVITTWALAENLVNFNQKGDKLLFGLGLGILILVVWTIIEAIFAFIGTKQAVSELEPEPETAAV